MTTELLAMWETIPFDHQTVVNICQQFLSEKYLILLESATHAGGGLARYSFLATQPLSIWEMDAAQRVSVQVDKGRKHAIQTTDPMLHLREFVRNYTVKVTSQQVDRGEAQLCQSVGAFGYFSYEFAEVLEPSIGQAPPRTLKTPLGLYFVPKTVLVFDHLRQCLTMIVYGRQAPHEAVSKLNARLIKDMRLLKSRILKAKMLQPLKRKEAVIEWDKLKSSLSKQDFVKAAQSNLENIRAGEIFQIQIGRRIHVKTRAKAFNIFRHLRMLNPSPYMFFFKFNDHHILGASPEMMVGVSGSNILHRPIAGTRRRLWDAERDQRMRHELQTSEKERAEHVMLVDLARNDIGRVAKEGSVKVDELMTIEEYSHVFHLVSQVSGQLAQDGDAFDAMRASFPNGTVTGAPKIRAMQLIAQYEPHAREFYAGSLGVFGFDGNLKSTILIRTIYMHGQNAYTQASAGLVYDSVPEHEWLETQNKLAACVTAMCNTV